jgi:hypothetical protein
MDLGKTYDDDDEELWERDVSRTLCKMIEMIDVVLRVVENLIDVDLISRNQENHFVLTFHSLSIRCFKFQFYFSTTQLLHPRAHLPVHASVSRQPSTAPDHQQPVQSDSQARSRSPPSRARHGGSKHVLTVFLLQRGNATPKPRRLGRLRHLLALSSRPFLLHPSAANIQAHPLRPPAIRARRQRKHHARRKSRGISS